MRKQRGSIFLYFWVLSFIIFWLTCVLAGGDAVNGKIEDGHYYFGSHGEYTEVSRAAYVLSAGYLLFLEITVSLFMFFLFGVTLKGMGMRIRSIKDLSGLIVLLPLLIGLGFSVGAFQSLLCILRALGIFGSA